MTKTNLFEHAVFRPFVEILPKKRIKINGRKDKDYVGNEADFGPLSAKSEEPIIDNINRYTKTIPGHVGSISIPKSKRPKHFKPIPYTIAPSEIPTKKTEVRVMVDSIGFENQAHTGAFSTYFAERKQGRSPGQAMQTTVRLHSVGRTEWLSKTAKLNKILENIEKRKQADCARKKSKKHR
jgi:hypothetical protein